MGIPSVFTDHSLFGFSDTSSILTNKLLMGTLANAQAVICVSHTSKENTVLRASLSPHQVYVIPNAVVPEQFYPDANRKRTATSKTAHLLSSSFMHNLVTVVVASRLVYRKGIDLLTGVIPRICKHYKNIKFVIAGDGPKRVDLEQMREKHLLMDRVELVGAVASHQVRDVLVKGDIFLNTSLTEAFCMAIIEAACCGLLVVSTRVGGVPEVLPEEMMVLAKPDEQEMLWALEKAIDLIQKNQVDTSKFHERVTQMYSWQSVAEGTDRVYQEIFTSKDSLTIMNRLECLYTTGFVYGKILCILAIIEHLILKILNLIFPQSSIPKAPVFSREKYQILLREDSPLLYQY